MSASIHQNSSHFDTVPDTNLSPAQAQVIAALALGRSVTAAALEAGLHRTTIHHWLRSEPAFKIAVRQARTEYVATLNDSLRDLAALALKTLHDLLADPETPPAVRLKAALAVLQRPHYPNEGWHLPERIESPREMEVDQRALRMTCATEANAPRKETETAAPVARNAPCPCGSDKKYKRCCGTAAPNFPHTASAAA